MRIVAATNRDLISDGFRNDLYHRICQIHIHIPALRDRRDRYRPLAIHFFVSNILNYRLQMTQLRLWSHTPGRATCVNCEMWLLMRHSAVLEVL